MNPCGEKFLDTLELEMKTKKNWSFTMKKWQCQNYFEKNKMISTLKKNDEQTERFTVRRSSEDTDISKKYQEPQKKGNESTTKLPPLRKSFSDSILLEYQEKTTRNDEEFEPVAKSVSLMSRDASSTVTHKKCQESGHLGASVEQLELSKYSLLPRLVLSSSYSYDEFSRVPRKQKLSSTNRFKQDNCLRLNKDKRNVNKKKNVSFASIEEVSETATEDERHEKLSKSKGNKNEKVVFIHRGRPPSISTEDLKPTGNVPKPPSVQAENSCDHSKIQQTCNTKQTVEADSYNDYRDICRQLNLWIPSSSLASFYK